MNTRIEPEAMVRVLASTVFTLLLLGAAVTVAEAQVRTGRLNDDSCLVNDFTAFDDVVMTAVATHDSGGGDVYQAICDDEDCWGFSINRGSQVNVMTTGLTLGDYQWFVCAWNGSVRRVVANLAGGVAIFARGSRQAALQPRRVGLDAEGVPESLRRFAARLQRIGPRSQ